MESLTADFVQFFPVFSFLVEKMGTTLRVSSNNCRTSYKALPSNESRTIGYPH